MAVNRYDTPAQLQFINTYVPIPFEQLYTLGREANARVDKALEDFGKSMDKFGDFRSRSNKDMQTWYDETIGKQMPYIDQMAKNPDLIKDRAFRAQMQASINNVDRALLSKLKQNAAQFDEYKKMEQQLALAGKGNPLWHNRDFSNYDSTIQGLFDETPIPYSSVNDMIRPYVDNLKASDMGVEGGYLYSGVSQERTRAQVDANLSEILSTPQAQMHMRTMINAGATPEQAKAMFIDQVYTAANEAAYKQRTGVDPYAMAAYQNKLNSDLARVKKGGTGGDERSILPTAYDETYKSIDVARVREALYNTNNAYLNDFGKYAESYVDVLSAYTAAAQAHKSGEITKEQFDEIKKGFNKYESDMHDLYKSAVQTEIGKESGVGLLTNVDEVNRKKHNLAKGLEGAFDNLSVNINDGISTAYTELGASKSQEIKFNGAPTIVYAGKLGNYTSVFDLMNKEAGVKDLNKHFDPTVNNGSGHDVRMIETLLKQNGYISPTNRGYTSNVDGVNTLMLGYDGYIPVAGLGKMGASVQTAVVSHWGSDYIVTDENGDAYIRIPLVRGITRDSNDAQYFSSAIDKLNAGTGFAKEQVPTNVYTHTSNVFK